MGAVAGREGLWDDMGEWLRHNRNRPLKDLLVEHGQECKPWSQTVGLGSGLSYGTSRVAWGES